MDRSQKAESVAQLNAVFNEVGVVVVTRNLGLSVGQSTDLRAKMREAGGTYKVAKNRLARLALKNTQYEGLEERSEEHTSELQSRENLVCRLPLARRKNA